MFNFNAFALILFRYECIFINITHYFYSFKSNSKSILRRHNLGERWKNITYFNPKKSKNLKAIINSKPNEIKRYLKSGEIQKWLNLKIKFK